MEENTKSAGYDAGFEAGRKFGFIQSAKTRLGKEPDSVASALLDCVDPAWSTEYLDDFGTGFSEGYFEGGKEEKRQ